MSELEVFEYLANNALNQKNNDRFEKIISSLGADVQEMINNNNDLALRQRLSNKTTFTDSISIVLKKDNHLI